MTTFAFNFLPEIDATNAPQATPFMPPMVEDGVDDDDERATTNNNTPTSMQRRRTPFVWLTEEDFRPLLNERSTEDIVYTDISIGNNNNINDASSDCSGATTTGTATPIKCVDLTLSSYQKTATATASGNDNEEVWKTTDILPGLYEGGRKVWECSLDLLQYLVQEQITLDYPLGKNQTGNIIDDNDESSTTNNPIAGSGSGSRPMFALELGCGHGLPGCYLLRTAMEEQFHQREGNGNDELLHQQQERQQPSVFTVVMTDYNESVILDATLSNLVLNCGHIRTTGGGSMDRTIESVDDNAPMGRGGGRGEANPSSRMASATYETSVSIDELAHHVLLGSGDWMDMSNQLRQNQQQQQQQHDMEVQTTPWSTGTNQKLPPGGKFDIMLASETLYSQDAAHDTVRLIQRHLRPDTGVAYVATKRYYFGVNGGVDAFRFFASRNTKGMANSDNDTLIAMNDDDEYNELDIETVKVIDSGSGNIREVLRVRCYACKA